MTRSLYDDPAFFEGFRHLGRSIHGLDGATRARDFARRAPGP